MGTATPMAASRERDDGMSLDGGGSEAGNAAAPGASTWQHLLFTWLSPAFPVGAFAYSHGLEMAVERGLVTRRDDVRRWITALTTQGSLRNDLLLLAEAHRATSHGDMSRLAAANALALAMQPSAERYLETTQQGGSFVTAIAAAWSHEGIVSCRSALDGDIAYAIAVGMAAGLHGIPLQPTLDAFAFAFTGNLTSAAIRLGVIGQTDAQIVVAASATSLRAAAQSAATGTLDDIFSATPSADLCSLEHETQYSRLFRS